MSANADLMRLSADFSMVQRRARPEVMKMLKRGAQNIKDDARSNVSTHPSWRRIAPSITYEPSVLPGAAGMRYDVGYEDRGQGELAGIYEFGSARRSGNPTLVPAFEREAPRFAREADALIDRVLGDL